jgi:hypothetical protein
MKVNWCLAIALCACASVAQAGTASGDLLDEDFDDLTLNPTIEETSGGQVIGTIGYTKSGPTDWVIDKSGVPFEDADEDPSNNIGVEEWEGWSFASAASVFKVVGQGRQNFARGTGVVAVADPDEYDDAGNPLSGTPAAYSSVLSTPFIDLTGIAVGSTIYISFDSSFRGEDPASDEGIENQTGIVSVNFGLGFGGSQELLRYASDPADPAYAGADVHADNEAANPHINEEIMLSFVMPNLAGEGLPENASLSFTLQDAYNDWWWAIDNLKVGTSLASEGPEGDYNGDGTVNSADYTVWRDGGSPDDTIAGYNLWRTNFGQTSGTGTANAVPEPTAWLLGGLACMATLFGRCRSPFACDA